MNLNDAIKKVKEGFGTGVKPAENSFEDAVMTLADNVGQGGGGGGTEYPVIDLSGLNVGEATSSSKVKITGVYNTMDDYIYGVYPDAPKPFIIKGIMYPDEVSSGEYTYPMIPTFASGYKDIQEEKIYISIGHNTQLIVDSGDNCWFGQ